MKRQKLYFIFAVVAVVSLGMGVSGCETAIKATVGVGALILGKETPYDAYNDNIFKVGVDTKTTIVNKLGKPDYIIDVEQPGKEVLAYDREAGLTYVFAVKDDLFIGSAMWITNWVKSAKASGKLEKNTYNFFPAFQQPAKPSALTAPPPQQ